MEEDIRAVFAAAPATIRSLQVFAEIVRGPLSEASAARWAEVLRSVEQHDLLGVEDPGRTAGQRRRAMERQKFAAAQEKSAAPLLNRILSVNLWAVLETFVEDVAAAWLVEEPAAWEREAVAKPKGSLAAFALLTREQQARVLVHEIGESSGAALRPGVTALDSILTAVGLEGSIPDPVRRGLIDLSQVRNVLLHRWGRVDEKLIERCPWRRASLGSEVIIDDATVQAYAWVAYWFTLAVSLRWFERRWPGPFERHESQQEFVAWTRDTLAVQVEMLEMSEAVFIPKRTGQSPE